MGQVRPNHWLADFEDFVRFFFFSQVYSEPHPPSRSTTPHLEENFDVRHRLGRHHAAWAMDFERDGPDQIAVAIAEEIGRPVNYRAVDPSGARRAAQAISEML